MSEDTFILDTSAYSGFNKGDDRLRPWFTSTNIILLPIVVIGELEAGFAAGSKTERNEELLEQFLGSSSVRIVPLSLATTKKFASLFLQIRKAGISIGVIDLWIAALTQEYNCPLLTLDSDFKNVPGITIIPL